MTTSTNGSIWLTAQPDIQGALQALESGGIVLFPTDTLWSLGCDAFNPAAIRRLLYLTHMNDASGAEVLTHSLDAAKEIVEHLHPRLETLLHFHQRPLTILVDRARRLPAEATGPDGEVAIRIVHDPFVRSLLQSFGRPVFSAFAGVAGKPYPPSFGSISSEIIQGCNHVVRYRQMERSFSEPSVMVRLCEITEELVFLRE